MAMRAMREQRKKRWGVKLGEMFQDMDKGHQGVVELEKVQDLYRIYKVEWDEGAAKQKLDSNGMFTKEKFIQFGLDTKLLDLNNTNYLAKGSILEAKDEDSASLKGSQKRQKSTKSSRQKSGLCCCLSG